MKSAYDMSEHEEFREVADSFNSMAERLRNIVPVRWNDILSAKKFLEAHRKQYS